MLVALLELACGGIIVPMSILALIALWLVKRPQHKWWIILTITVGTFTTTLGWLAFFLWYMVALNTYNGDLNIIVQKAVEAPWSWTFTQFVIASFILGIGLPILLGAAFFRNSAKK